MNCFSRERRHDYCCSHPHHTTHPTHTNSTSTRNKSPSGLKFCMRPHLTKLTTTHHNFNPTIFWEGGGGPYILNLGLTLPVFLDKKKIGSKSFDQILFCPKNFYPTFFLPKIFMTQKIFDLKIFRPKIFWPKIFLTENCF